MLLAAIYIIGVFSLSIIITFLSRSKTFKIRNLDDANIFMICFFWPLFLTILLSVILYKLSYILGDYFFNKHVRKKV
jgi:maltodextrin utilization protein YvdJ